MKTDALTTACAGELRGAIEDFVGNVHDDDALTRATELLAEVRRALVGPTAPRYYEPAARSAVSADTAFQEYLHESPFGGGNNPVSPPGVIELDLDETQPCVIGRVNAGRLFEGPARCLHGGTVAGLFDHFLGMAQHAFNRARGTEAHAATRELTVRYVAPTPLDTELVFRAWMEDVDERTFHGHATCHAGDVLTATAEGEFVKLGMARMLSAEPGGFNSRP